MTKKIDLNCPACESSEIRYRTGAKDYYCRRCGAVFTIERDTRGIVYHVTNSPTTRTKQFELFRKWGE